MIAQTQAPSITTRLVAVKTMGECGRVITQQNSNGELLAPLLQALINLLRQSDESVMTEAVIAL